MFKYVFSLILAVIFYFVFLFDTVLTNEVIGSLFVTGILGCLVVFLVFKFGLHYKILGLNRFANAFYYSVFEYKKAQVSPSELTYMDSVREQAEVALAANFDPTLKTADLKIPTELYSGKDPFLAKLRAKIQKAEKIKLDARHLDRKADVLLGKTQEELVEKDLTDKTPTAILDRIFEIENGVAAIIDLTVDEIRSQGYGRAPDYEIITQIALDENPYFARTFRYFDSEDIVGVLFRAPFMIILIGIIGTFAGFYLALNAGGDIKSGASVAIVSSLVGLPVSLFMEYLNTLFPDEGRYKQAFNKFRVTLEMLFNHEQELNKTQNEGEMALALARAEQEQVDALAEQEAELEKQRLMELTSAEKELREQAEGALAAAEQERVDALAKQEAELEKAKELALAKAEQERVDALAKQEAELYTQKLLELTTAEQELKGKAEAEAAKLKKETESALAKAKQERVDALAKQEAALEKQRQLDLSRAEQELKKQVDGEAANVKKETERALAKAEKERVDALAKQEAALEKQRQLEVAKAEQELKKQTERETEKLKKEKELAMAEAALAHKAELAAQKSALEEENAKVLSDKEQSLYQETGPSKEAISGSSGRALVNLALPSFVQGVVIVGEVEN